MDKIKSLYELVERGKNNFGLKPLYKFNANKETITVSYSDFYEYTTKVALALEKIGARGKRVMVVTSDYHLRRSVMTARRVGFRAKGVAAAIEHDVIWKAKRNKEFAYTFDLIMGWQDEGRSRPAWTYRLFDTVFVRKNTKR